MARDAGLSALFVCGSAMAAFCTIRAFRREAESGTLEMALARPVSRGGFFLAKVAGAAAAYLVFALTVFGTQLAVVWGAAVGGAVAAQTGGLVRVFGPALAAGVVVIVVPLAVAAALSRLARFRFVLSSFACAFALSVAVGAVAASLAPRMALRLLPAAVLVVFPALVLLAASAAAAVRLKANAAASVAGLAFLAMLPAVGNYYLSDALSGGGRIPWPYVGIAALAALPALAAALTLGVALSGGWRKGEG